MLGEASWQASHLVRDNARNLKIKIIFLGAIRGALGLGKGARIESKNAPRSDRSVYICLPIE